MESGTETKFSITKSGTETKSIEIESRTETKSGIDTKSGTESTDDKYKLSDDKGTEHTRLLAMQHAVRHLLSNVAVLSSHTPGLDKLLI